MGTTSQRLRTDVTNRICTHACATIGAAPTPPALNLPTPTGTAPAAEADVAVSILIDGAAIRSAPATTATLIRTAAAGETLRTVGQVDDYKWLYVVDTNNKEGWISGNLAYSQIAGDCDDLPSREPPTPRRRLFRTSPS